MTEHPHGRRKPKMIVNDPAAAVRDFLEGLLLQYPNRLVALQNHNGILAARPPPLAQKVFLVSGGGSGHEPSHAGWIGSRGMLSAAVCGGVFASPSVQSILATIHALAHRVGLLDDTATKYRDGAGVLFIVKNYTGDRLNFGVAAERAAQEFGINTAMVVVADDCAIPRTKGITGARGVAGTVLIHKIAGSAASQGLSLAQVVQWANHAAARMGTLAVALDAVTIPGAEFLNDRLEHDDIIEMGLGIHGEAGISQMPLLTSDGLAKNIIHAIRDYGRVKASIPENDSNGAVHSDRSVVVPMFEPGDELVLLVNNLGGTSNFEMSIFARSCVHLLESSEFGSCSVRRLYVGSFMTSFGMHGASLTILNVSKEVELMQFLDDSTDALAWIACDVWSPSDIQRPSGRLLPDYQDTDMICKPLAHPPLMLEHFEVMATSMVESALHELVAAEPILTEYDTIVGDGDCGITMKRGATEILKRLELGTLKTNHPVPLFTGIADAISSSMGGTSGILLELLFRKMGTSLARSDCITSSELSVALSEGVEVVSVYGGASVGSRTMLDAFVPAMLELQQSNDLQQAAISAQTGANQTAAMLVASAGRSNYLSAETLQGTPDPGAVAVAIVFAALAKVLA